MTEVKPGSPQHVGVDTVIQFKMKKGKLTGLKIAPLDDMPNLPSFCEPQVHIGDMPSQLSKDTGRTLDFYAFCQEVEKDKTQDGDPRITFTLRNDSQESAKMVWCTPHDAKYNQLAGCVIYLCTGPGLTEMTRGSCGTSRQTTIATWSRCMTAMGTHPPH